MTNKKNSPLDLTLDRRHFITVAAASPVVLSGAASAQASTPHIVVVGGGFAGSTAAKYLKHWGGSAVRVSLVDPSAVHYSCVMSNLVLDRTLTLSDLRFRHSALAGYGVTHVKDRAVSVDVENRQLRLRRGDPLPFDKLVLTGGIAFKPVRGWNRRAAPHAWIAGGQTNLLRNRLAEVPADGTVVMTVPPAPYRCPPGPYERACTFAHIMRSKGGRPKVVVLDANPQIAAERGTFSKAFFQEYADIIDYRPNSPVTKIDPNGQWIETSAGRVHGDLVNYIPQQRAAGIVRKAGLLPKGQLWAPVDPLSYESTMPGREGIYVVGDSQGTSQPKSGHMANSQAKVCADAILRSLAGRPLDDPQRLRALTTNSACFSPITATEASWLTAVFQYDQASGAMKVVPASLAESGGWNRENFSDMYSWSRNLWGDTFS
ncbi:MAG: NAD(P)/FAD-dependent oxidoreductase [Parvularcula sp.]